MRNNIKEYDVKIKMNTPRIKYMFIESNQVQLVSILLYLLFKFKDHITTNTVGGIKKIIHETNLTMSSYNNTTI